MFSCNTKYTAYSFFQQSQHKSHKHLPSPSLLKLLTFSSWKQQSVDDKLVPRKKLRRKATWIFCKVNDVLSSLLESSQGFVAHSQRLFEFTHQWRIKGCGDDRGSIKSRSLEDEGGEGNNMKLCRVAGSQLLPHSEIESCRMFARPCLALSEPDNQP